MGIAESRLGSPTSSFSNIAALGGRNDQQLAHKQDVAGADIFWAITEPCLAVGSPGTRGGSSKILGTSDYANHPDDCRGAPRNDTPNDVMADLGTKVARSLPATAGAVSSPTSATSPVAASPPETHVGQTPSSINFFIGHGKRLRPHDDETGRTATPAAADDSSPMQSLERSQENANSPHTTVRPARHSAPEAQPSSHGMRMSTCSECHAVFSGPTYMLKDLAYCCQRHRLLAYQTVTKPEPLVVSSRSEGEPDLHVLLHTGVRASFCAWI